MATGADKPTDRTEQRNSRSDRDTLLDQARQAADQAIELARAAQESAKLARQLNATAMQQTGVQLESLPVVSAHSEPVSAEPPPPAGQPEPAVTAPLVKPTGKPIGKQRKRGRRERLLDRVQRSRQRTEKSVPKRVKIKVRKGDLERPEGIVPFLRQNWNSMTASGAIIVVTLMILALYVLPALPNDPINTVIASFSDEPAVVVEDLPAEDPEDEPGEQMEEETEDPVEEPEPEPEPDPEPEPMPEPEDPPPAEEAPAEEEPVAEVGTEPAANAEPAVDFSKEGSRSENAKRALLQKYGGTAASESAVGNALKWFNNHQRRDGSWNFNDVGASGGAGSVNNPMGATAYVLLCYLGAGQTHKKGEYKKQVRAGLDFLLRGGRAVGDVVDFSGMSGQDKDTHERFYVHGAVSMVLTEAYSMTKDRRLRKPAQGAVNAIIRAQDPRGGGWRYVPYEPGSTSVTGLQITALISAKKAGFKVPANCLKGCSAYLDSVRSDDTGARYGYTAAKPTYKSSVTAIATLCRMYLGWDRDTPELRRCIELLDDKGPASNSMYYVYYATQAMRNWGGPEWERWNKFTREELLRTQETAGDAAGSWPTRNRSLEAKAGGRLFMTCLATLTLEVYYRYLPLYDDLGGSGKRTEESN